MRTRNALFVLFALLVAVPVGAAIYLGTVGVARERGMLIDRENDAMRRRASDIRDALRRQLQADARRGVGADIDAINRDYLDPASPRAVLPRIDEHVDRVRLVRDDPRERLTRPDPYGLPRFLYLTPYPSPRDPGGAIALPDGYMLVFDVRPSRGLARDLVANEERVNWTLGITAVVVGLGLLFAWRAVRAETKLAERKAEFVSAVSHELRTPLTSIRMYADMLKEGWVGDAKQAEDYFKLISAESERLARLVNNVLDFSRIEKGSKAFDMRMGDPAPIVHDTVEMLRPYLEEKGFALEVDMPETLPSCQFDKDALTQILVNLIDNAVKYGAEEVRVEGLADNGEVKLRVLDRGPGVPSNERETIFEAFHQGQNAKAGGGSGLGLALVDAYAKAHEGRVEVDEREGGGAVFSLCLPAA
ncbi:MAG: HAMP domain-containing sensor histidine kinase [Planctomycetota bacterium]